MYFLYFNFGGNGLLACYSMVMALWNAFTSTINYCFRSIRLQNVINRRIELAKMLAGQSHAKGIDDWVER